MRASSAALLLLFALAPAQVVFAAEDSSTITPEQIAALRLVTEVATSPDGRHIAFTRSVPRRPGIDDDGEPWTELHVVELATRRERPFVTGKGSVQSIAWTPDSSNIVFLAKRGDDKFRGLYFIPVDGGEARRAFTLKSDISAFSLSQDGKRVAALATDPENEERKKLKEKGFKQEVFEEDWRYTRVWLGRTFEENATNISPMALTGSVRQVRWNPAADQLALAVTPTPSVDDGLIRQQIIIVDATTNGVVRGRVEHTAKLGAFEWSPDGRQIAFIAGEDQHDPSDGRLFVVPATGGKPRQVLPNFEGEVTGLGWRNAEEIVYSADQGTLSLLGRISLRGSSATSTNLHGPGHPIIKSISLSRDGSVLGMAADSRSHPAELFSLNLQSPKPERLTDSNPSLKNIRLATQETIRYRARDGLDIEGVLVRPLDARGQTRYPLILAVHGGPEAHVSDGWVTSYSNPGQLAAAQGFAVLYPNYRGSTARGVAFSRLGQGDAAGREFDDLVDAVDHLIRIGLVDRDKVGVTGGSYGGYATAWCSTRFSERFAAGVMFVGISDKVSKVGTTDIPDEEFYVHARKRPWEDWQFQLERSPIFHAGSARTPLLILHGADDPRVHPGQSKEMFRHLKLRSRAPVRLVLYPGEGHGNRKAAARYDYNLRMMQWFNHYLKGPGGAMPDYNLEYNLPRE